LNIRRKGAGIAFTATLLSALVATVAAPLAFASVGVTSAGSVPRGGTSTGTATFTFTENTAACFTGAGSPDLQVVITDSAGAAKVGFSGTATVVAPTATLGAVTTSLSNTGGHTNDTLNINFSNASNFNVEVITVSGLKITADSDAATGAIKATLLGSEAPCVLPGTATATGILQTAIPSGAAFGPAQINVTSVCPFAVTALPTPSNADFSLVSDPRAITAASPVVGGIQTVTFGAGTVGQNIVPNNTVTQTVPNCSASIASPGTVANAIEEDVLGPVPNVIPGQTNQRVADVILREATFGDETTFGTSGTITFTLVAAGVTFSGSPTADPSGGVNLGSLAGAGFPVSCSVSVDRKSCSVTITSNAVGSGTDTILLTNIFVDVDTTAVLGTKVVINVTGPAAPIIVTNNVVAFVGRTVISTAAQPVIFIGQNDQATGTITLTESGPGFFSSTGGPTNFFTICYVDNPDETFTRAPWAVVTNGDLKLLSGSTGVSQVAGTLVVVSGNSCAFWQIFSNSTVASTIEIRGSTDGTTPLPAGANNGPRLNVPANAAPGSVQGTFGVGTIFFVGPQLFSNAIRAFQNNVSVTASSQPRCLQGATDCLAGNIVITETQNGQLRAGTTITVDLLPRASTQRMDVLLQTTGTNQAPIVTTNAAASGLLVTPVGLNCTPSAIFGVVVCQISLQVTQQSFGPTLGTLTISNIHYVVAADAVNGPVNVDVKGVGGALGAQVFDSVVSNAIIGAAPVVTQTKTQAASAVTKTNLASAFTVGTKVVHVVPSSNNIVTIRIKVDPALVGKSVVIQRAIKTGGDAQHNGGTFGAFTNISTRVIGADGYAYYYASTHTAQWLSFRGMFPGNAQFSASTSQTVQVHWI
jgi:hypothetical protein